MKAAATQKTALRKHNNYVIKASWGGVHRMATPHKRRELLHNNINLTKQLIGDLSRPPIGVYVLLGNRKLSIGRAARNKTNSYEQRVGAALLSNHLSCEEVVQQIQLPRCNADYQQQTLTYCENNININTKLWKVQKL